MIPHEEKLVEGVCSREKEEQDRELGREGGRVLNYCTHALSLENVIVFCLHFFLVFYLSWQMTDNLSWQMTDRVNMHHGKDNTLTYKETYNTRIYSTM